MTQFGQRSRAESLFLKPGFQLEPLVNSFYAWIHTVAPGTAASHVAFSQLPLLDSYLDAPDIHFQAASNPVMRGGPFVDVDPARIDDVRTLRNSISQRCVSSIEFAMAVRSLHELLEREATGVALANLYTVMPPGLRGLVELGYDLSDAPVVRFLEPALYRSACYDESVQSVDLTIATQDSRPFALTTPRLEQREHVQLSIPFRHEGLNQLIRMVDSPLTYTEIRDALEIDLQDDRAFRSLFTNQPAEPAATPPGRRRGVRYFGHACVVFETEDATVITDPFVSPMLSNGRLTYADLPETLDVCLITHAHHDHAVLETLLHLRHRIGTVVVPTSSAGSPQDPSLRLCLERLGFPSVVEVSSYDEVRVPGGCITACPFVGEHGDLDIRSKATYAVRLGDELTFVGADSSGVIPEVYATMRRELGVFTTVLIGMECGGAPLDWLYGPLFPRPMSREACTTRRLAGSNAEQAWTIVSELGARRAFVYAMGEEPWAQHLVATNYTNDSYQMQQVAEFLKRCDDEGARAGHLVGTAELDC